MPPLKISIITPSLNQGKYLESNIISVHQQPYTHREHLIIDGGSTDNTNQIIQKHQEKLAYWVSEKDNGQSEAINKGFKKASGDILTWLNSDDQLMPGSLEKVASIFENNPTIDVVS